MAHEGYLMVNVPVSFPQFLIFFSGAAGTVAGPPAIPLSEPPNTCYYSRLPSAELPQHIFFCRKALTAHIEREKRVPQNHLPDREKFGWKLRTELADSTIWKYRTQWDPLSPKQFHHRGLVFNVT